jgi:glyoxylase-like metal-dependent hydrolase (beta-lactamase superfamily II)
LQDRGDGSADVLRLVREELELLERVKPAPDKLTSQVHLYPTQGVTPGAAGLLLALPARTVLVAGDAVISQEYYEAGQVFEQCADLPQARESLGEIVEVADEIVPGHDNVFRVLGR